MMTELKAESTKNPFLTLLESSSIPLLADGAMGTLLNARGVGFEQCFDALNLTNPELVLGIHRDYLLAGAQVVQTNTFGANRTKLAAHELEGKLVEINQAGVKLARLAAQPIRSDALVAGDVGPLGIRLAPYGRVKPEIARQLYVEQIAALVEAGVDLLILETFSDINDLRQALLAARQVSNLPVVASCTFTRDNVTLLGDSPAKVARELESSGADVIGANCSGGPAQVLQILRSMRQVVPQAFYSVMPNGGWPELVGGRVMYPAHPGYFADFARSACLSGARLIGGCCGTTPEHIAAMHAALTENSSDCAPEPSDVAVQEDRPDRAPMLDEPSDLARKLGAGRFVVAVEMDPPRGLTAHQLVAGASLLAEAGADVIDVADSPMARMRMSPWAVCHLLQKELQVETVLHFPTRGRNLLRVQGDLLAAHALGIRNVFVVMGDPTAIGDYPQASDDYDLVPSGLIALIKNNFNAGFDHAGADLGQPTTFFAGCALNLASATPAREMKRLQRKVKAGADFILTQPVFQPEQAEAFLARYRESFGPLDIPVLVGILPLSSARHATFLNNEVPGISIPDAILHRLSRAGADAPQEGVRLAVDLIGGMRSWAQGIYLMPALNRYDLAAEIIEAVK